MCRDKCRFYFCLYIDVAYYAQFIGNTRELLYEITLTILTEIVDFSPFFHVIKTAPKKKKIIYFIGLIMTIFIVAFILSGLFLIYI